MKRIFGLTGVLVALAMFAAVQRGIVYARLTGTEPGTDVWCVGVSGAEVCVDASGNIIPTTTNDADLGTSSLVWNELHLTAGGLTNASIVTADIADGAVDTNKIGSGAVNTNKILGAAVVTNSIADSAVDTAKIGAAAVNWLKIAGSSIDSTKLAASAVETAKIATGAVDTTKLLFVGTVDTGKYLCVNASSKAIRTASAADVAAGLCP